MRDHDVLRQGGIQSEVRSWSGWFGTAFMLRHNSEILATPAPSVKFHAMWRPSRCWGHGLSPLRAFRVVGGEHRRAPPVATIPMHSLPAGGSMALHGAMDARPAGC